MGCKVAKGENTLFNLREKRTFCSYVKIKMWENKVGKGEGRGKEKLRESLGCFEIKKKKRKKEKERKKKEEKGIIASLTRRDEDETLSLWSFTLEPITPV